MKPIKQQSQTELQHNGFLEDNIVNDFRNGKFGVAKEEEYPNLKKLSLVELLMMRKECVATRDYSLVKAIDRLVTNTTNKEDNE